MHKLCAIVVILLNVPLYLCVPIDAINCGVDHELTVSEGYVEIDKYPWIGILYYEFYGEAGEVRSVTSVVLIQREFVLAVAADIHPMPKRDFRRNARVLLGESWTRPGRRVRNYVIHPEYGQTLNTIALVQLKDPVRFKHIKPLCAPPKILRNPVFYVVKFDSDFNDLKKKVIPVEYVPSRMCEDFYIAANLYMKKRRPPHVACAVSLETNMPCVWDAGSALVARDVWGRWQFLGLGVRGPGCGAPSRYLDMASYYPWIEYSLSRFNQITISKIHKQKYVLRSSGETNYVQRYGACDDEEREEMIFRELIFLYTDNMMYQILRYNLTIRAEIEYTCMTLELINASASSEMRIIHTCPSADKGEPCHRYLTTDFDIAVYLMFSESCMFEMYTWGRFKRMNLTDIQEWKWEEGTYYEDFSMKRHEYRGYASMTGFGFEPLDERVWVPEYDLFTTTAKVNLTSSNEFGVVQLPGLDEEEAKVLELSAKWPYWFQATPAPNATTTAPIFNTATRGKRTKRYFITKTPSNSMKYSTTHKHWVRPFLG